MGKYQKKVIGKISLILKLYFPLQQNVACFTICGAGKNIKKEETS